MSVQPGWYADPADPSTQRYWDGEGWIGAPLPVDATPPASPPPESPPEQPAPVSPPPPGVPFAPDLPFPPGTPIPPPIHPGPTPGVPSGGAAGPSGTGPMPPSGAWPPPGWRPPLAQPVPPRPHGLVLASLGSRLVARLIDIGVVFLLNVVVNSWFVWQFIQEMSPLIAEVWRRSLAGDRSTEGLPQPDPRVDGLIVAILFLAAALWFAYEVPALANRGQTFGKRVMGIKVVPLGEEKQLGFARSIRRWNTLGLPVLLWYCCIGFLLQLVDCLSPLFDRPLHQALHDKRALTVVVQVPPPPAGEPTNTPEVRNDRP